MRKLLGMEGFSEALLKNHITLYQGYVNNTNKLTEARFHAQGRGQRRDEPAVRRS